MSNKENNKMELTGAQIEQIATENNMNTGTSIPSQFEEIEYKTVVLKSFVTAFFLMNNETFKYTYSHTYNAMTDKTTKRTPKMFK
jgi:hypothetical protein